MVKQRGLSVTAAGLPDRDSGEEEEEEEQQQQEEGCCSDFEWGPPVPRL